MVLHIACSTPAVVDSGCVGTPDVAPTVTSVAGNMKTTLSWNAVDGASKYQVFRTEGVKQCGQGKVLLATLSPSTLKYTDAGLQNGREYFYVVIPKGPNASCFGKFMLQLELNTTRPSRRYSLSFVIFFTRPRFFMHHCDPKRISKPNLEPIL